MKIQNNQRRQTILLMTFAAIILFGANISAFAQPGSGTKYGSRDARTCVDTKAPGNGAMTTALATKYVFAVWKAK